jgi:hypothetical protein
VNPLAARAAAYGLNVSDLADLTDDPTELWPPHSRTRWGCAIGDCRRCDLEQAAAELAEQAVQP